MNEWKLFANLAAVVVVGLCIMGIVVMAFEAIPV